ncbi:unnamed protein product [Linum trigynum]|uniref:Uncharacterized protein n=1 Tax=Linum trigynum TaxID=586398 RepID=A0AAV2GQ39_9ROSI
MVASRWEKESSGLDASNPNSFCDPCPEPCFNPSSAPPPIPIHTLNQQTQQTQLRCNSGNSEDHICANPFFDLGKLSMEVEEEGGSDLRSDNDHRRVAGVNP